MNCVLQSRRQLLMEVRRLGSYRGYMKYDFKRKTQYNVKSFQENYFYDIFSEQSASFLFKKKTFF